MRYLIIGAVAGGASAAARLRRNDEHAEIILFERGSHVSYANCGLPYYIGSVIKNRDDLFVQTAEAFRQRFNIDVRVKTEVLSINPTQKSILARNLITGEEYNVSYDKLLLSPGADAIRPPLPGINREGIFTLRNVRDTDFIKAYVNEKSVRKVAVVGAGFIGLEMAENLRHLGKEVSLIEMGNQVMAPLDYTMAAQVQETLRKEGVQLYLGQAVQRFDAGTDHPLRVELNSGKSLELDLVLLSIGVKPETKLASEAGLAIGNARGILVNEFLQTSNPDIYAVGDAIEFINPITGISMNTYLAGPANKQGRLAADNMVDGNKSPYSGSINTAIVKVFNQTVATTGMASKHLKAAGIPHVVSYTRSGSHAGYFPGARQMNIQLAFSPDNGRVLGAQIVGGEGVDKRIDVLSEIIKNQGTIRHLTEFEQAYAPPFSSAKDPINMAGFVAENILKGKHRIWNYFPEEGLPKGLLIDVRTPEEFSHGALQHAQNIPLDDLRSRMHELNPNEPIFIYCQSGLRGYLAQRILTQHGFLETFNLSGGYATYHPAFAEFQSLQSEKEKQQPVALGV
ncbi:MAG: FAD-dependent oxidoreductase [Bacteroidia bacterium]|nr:FAD-dependent oxidoreductase [Bacteroidia bacterium]